MVGQVPINLDLRLFPGKIRFGLGDYWNFFWLLWWFCRRQTGFSSIYEPVEWWFKRALRAWDTKTLWQKVILKLATLLILTCLHSVSLDSHKYLFRPASDVVAADLSCHMISAKVKCFWVWLGVSYNPVIRSHWSKAVNLASWENLAAQLNTVECVSVCVCFIHSTFHGAEMHRLKFFIPLTLKYNPVCNSWVCVDAGDKAPPSFSCCSHTGPPSSPVKTSQLPGSFLLSGLADLAPLLLSAPSCTDAETRWALVVAEVQGSPYNPVLLWVSTGFCFYHPLCSVCLQEGIWEDLKTAATIFPEFHSADIWLHSGRPARFCKSATG